MELGLAAILRSLTTYPLGHQLDHERVEALHPLEVVCVLNLKLDALWIGRKEGSFGGAGGKEPRGVHAPRYRS